MPSIRRTLSSRGSMSKDSNSSIEFVERRGSAESRSDANSNGVEAPSIDTQKIESASLAAADSTDHRMVPPRRASSAEALVPAPDQPSSSKAAKPPLSCFVIQVALTASLGGILFGYDLGIIAGALPSLTMTFDLSSSQQEMVVSTLYIGGGLGATLGGSLCDTIGRRKTILWTDVAFGLAALVLYAAPTVGVVVLGRILVGFAVAVSGIADVSYLHELAPPHCRGAMVSVNEACISLGFLLAFCVAHLLMVGGSNKNKDAWRVMFGVSGLVALVQFVGMWGMPESPAWLQQQGRHEERRAALAQIQAMSGGAGQYSYPEEQDASNHDEDGEASSTTNILHPTTYYEAVPDPHSTAVNMEDSIMRQSSFPMARPNRQSPYYYCYYVASFLYTSVRQFWMLCQQVQAFVVTTAHHYRRQAVIALYLSTAQQLSGQNNVLSYAPLIFAGLTPSNEDSPNDTSVQGFATLSIGLVKFVVTVLVIWKIESLGRRCLLLWGMGTICLGLLLVSIAFASVQSPVDVDSAATDASDSVGGFYLALTGVLLVVSGYSMSFGPLTWLLTSELFPVDVRGRALGTSTIVTYGAAFFVTSTFLTSQEWIGAGAVFAFYLLITGLGWLFAYWAIPDTGDKSAKEIESVLDDMPWWQGTGLEDDPYPGSIET